MKIRVCHKSGKIENIEIPECKIQRAHDDPDVMDGYISDCIQDLGIDYKWFRILTPNK